MEWHTTENCQNMTIRRQQVVQLHMVVTLVTPVYRQKDIKYCIANAAVGQDILSKLILR